MRIKLIGADLDGTLLRDDKSLSPRTAAAVRRFTRAGGVFVLASGRVLSAIAPVAEQLPEAAYQMEAGGAVLRRTSDGEILYHRPVRKESLDALARILPECGAPYDLFSMGVGQTREDLYETVGEWLLRTTGTDLFFRTRRPVESYAPFFSGERPAEKISLFFDDHETRSRARRMLDEVPGIVVTSSLPMNLEIMDCEATKGCALMSLAETLGIRPEETAAFGDNDNDRTMIAAAGIGVAMGNALDDLKAAADLVAPSNEDDGVARVMEEWMEEEIC